MDSADALEMARVQVRSVVKNDSMANEPSRQASRRGRK